MHVSMKITVIISSKKWKFGMYWKSRKKKCWRRKRRNKNRLNDENVEPIKDYLEDGSDADGNSEGDDDDDNDD